MGTAATETMLHANPSRQKRIELASAAGAGLLGFGLGALVGAWLSAYASALIVFGALLHGWAMYARWRLERNVALPLWSTILFWACWIALGALAAWLILE